MRYTPELAVRLATYLLVYDGFAALHLGGLLALAPALGVAVAVAATWGDPGRREGLRRVRGLTTGIAVAGLAALVLDLVYVAASVLDGLVHALIFLILYRLLAARTPREVGDVGFLAFFMLVAASPVTVGVGFLAVFVTFLVFGTWLLMLRHVLIECERSQAPDTRTLPARGRVLLQLSLVASAVTLVLTAVLFFTIPRVGQAALPLRAPLGRMVSGFSDRVELGSFGDIETDATVAMRVHFAETLPRSAAILGALRWRGVVLDAYDGRAWSVSQPRPRTILRRSAGGDMVVGSYRGAGPIVSQEVFLEPIGTEVIFGAPRILRLGLHAPAAAIDDAGGVTVTVPAARLHYTVESELELVSPRAAATANRPLRDEDRVALAPYLRLPPLGARVAALAREQSAGSAGPYDAAQRVTRFLSDRYRYTMTLERRTTLDPVEEFLFERRAGNCEYFAASLAVMLRTLAIPARVVNGFMRGEWNPYGSYFMVRMRDAHSWVEAYFTGVGWVTFDPSPRGDIEPPAAPGTVSLYLDALRLRWYRYVINWSLRDQVAAATQFHRAAGAWRAGSLPDWRAVPRRTLLLAGGVLVLGVGLVLVRHRHRPSGVRMVPAFYRRALAALARRGLAPARGETAREFCARACSALPAAATPFGGLTAVYERARFGAMTTSVEETRAVAEWLRALRRLPRRAAVADERAQVLR
jgi:transglutaminase-like putative cysteine protease